MCSLFMRYVRVCNRFVVPPAHPTNPVRWSNEYVLGRYSALIALLSIAVTLLAYRAI